MKPHNKTIFRQIPWFSAWVNLYIWIFAACSSTSHSKKPEDLFYPLPATSHTPLPQSLPRQSVPQATLVIPSGMIPCSTTVRPFVVLKTGPGEQFLNQDALITKGTMVVLINDSQVWKKIYIPHLKRSGWVHGKTLGTTFKNPHLVKIHTNHLPIVTTVAPKVRLTPYPYGVPTIATVPRGLVMTKLSNDARRQLVWFTTAKQQDLASRITQEAPSNVFWIDRRDAW